MKVIEIKEEEFEKVINEDKVLIDCYADWCNPCKIVSPTIDRIAEKHDDIKFYKLNMDEVDEITEKYNITSIPTIFIFEKGKLLKQEVGIKTEEEIENMLNN